MNKKIAMGCGIGCLGIVLIGGIATYLLVPKMLEWGEKQLEEELHRKSVASDWNPPKEATLENFFPQTVGDYDLRVKDDQAAQKAGMPLTNPAVARSMYSFTKQRNQKKRQCLAALMTSMNNKTADSKQRQCLVIGCTIGHRPTIRITFGGPRTGCLFSEQPIRPIVNHLYSIFSMLPVIRSRQTSGASFRYRRSRERGIPPSGDGRYIAIQV